MEDLASPAAFYNDTAEEEDSITMSMNKKQRSKSKMYLVILYCTRALLG